MSQQSTSSGIPLKYILGSIGIFVVFGFLALILSGFAGHESIEERAYMGEFSAETIEARWANFEEVSAAQASLVDEEKVSAALASLKKGAPKAAKSDIVVPGSPTFLKQMEDQAAEAAAAEAAAKKAEEKPQAEKAEPKSEPKPEAAAPDKPKSAPKEKPKAAPQSEAKPKAAPAADQPKAKEAAKQ